MFDVWFQILNNNQYILWILSNSQSAEVFPNNYGCYEWPIAKEKSTKEKESEVEEERTLYSYSRIFFFLLACPI